MAAFIDFTTALLNKLGLRSLTEATSSKCSARAYSQFLGRLLVLSGGTVTHWNDVLEAARYFQGAMASLCARGYSHSTPALWEQRMRDCQLLEDAMSAACKPLLSTLPSADSGRLRLVLEYVTDASWAMTDFVLLRAPPVAATPSRRRGRGGKGLVKFTAEPDSDDDTDLWEAEQRALENQDTVVDSFSDDEEEKDEFLRGTRTKGIDLIDPIDEESEDEQESATSSRSTAPKFDKRGREIFESDEEEEEEEEDKAFVVPDDEIDVEEEYDSEEDFTEHAGRLYPPRNRKRKRSDDDDGDSLRTQLALLSAQVTALQGMVLQLAGSKRSKTSE